ncbi:hypothetical protein SAMN05443667_105258 [Flavobacterium gillisiae]|uniref:Uncharacterized protein n=1 Tax=Flavobacterium gillisiae TaxID=150146 RepID=A0A1H4C7B0_9FLAO|nr:hypothetical protein [Flavobacterium gillisiae]SEA56264.1 hypothetical protein SAMN05443667_105258 [Flavobacterium gillisiae]
MNYENLELSTQEEFSYLKERLLNTKNEFSIEPLPNVVKAAPIVLETVINPANIIAAGKDMKNIVNVVLYMTILIIMVAIFAYKILFLVENYVYVYSFFGIVNLVIYIYILSRIYSAGDNLVKSVR